MSIRVKPISANLTRDTELLERMVIPPLSRTPTSKSTSEDNFTEHPSAKMEEEIPSGTSNSLLTQGQIKL